MCNCCFGLFNKIKKGSGASFCFTFSAWFFCKNVPYLILYQWTKFQCHTFFLSQDIKQNVLLISYLDSWWCHDVKTFLGSTSKAMANKGKKEGKMEIQKFEYLNIEKSFSDEIKKHFLKFLKGYHLVKNKNLIKNSGTSFKECLQSKHYPLF